MNDANLTQARALELFEYADGKLYRKSTGREAGTLHKTGRRQVYVDRRCYQVHRVIWLMSYGWLPEVVDHKDGDPLNNSLHNLRAADYSTNNMNRRTDTRNKTGVKGVVFYKRLGLHHVYIGVGNRKYKSFGYFKNLDEAERAAIAAREKYHGKFARHK